MNTVPDLSTCLRKRIRYLETVELPNADNVARDRFLIEMCEARLLLGYLAALPQEAVVVATEKICRLRDLPHDIRTTQIALLVALLTTRTAIEQGCCREVVAQYKALLAIAATDPIINKICHANAAKVRCSETAAQSD